MPLGRVVLHVMSCFLSLCQAYFQFLKVAFHLEVHPPVSHMFLHSVPLISLNQSCFFFFFFFSFLSYVTLSFGLCMLAKK